MTSSHAYFESIGADWTRLRRDFFPDDVRERALQAAGVEAGQRAADLGAGTGFVTEGLLECGLRVVAVDQSPAMLEALRRRLPRPERVDCRVGHAEALPIEDGALDHCFANMYLHHVPAPAAAIAEMARILRPGGRAVITDLDAHDFTFLREEHCDLWMGFRREDVREWFRAAGFMDVRVEGLGNDCCTTAESGENATIGIFLASGTKA